ncbi:hypothetical protein METP2_02349 [Methanosarcinales archaeon]|nr:hypothetical protein METP2_02349 [Methanosarcinales archaeon]
MIRITWNNKELEEEILSENFKEGGFGYLNLTLKMFIDSVDIIGGSFTFVKIFFNQLYGAFKCIDSEGFRNIKLFAAPDNRISAHGAEFYLNSKKNKDLILIKYQRVDMINEYKHIEVSFKELIKGVLESNEHLFNQVLEIHPGIKNDPEFIQLKQEMEIVKGWYKNRYGKQL